MEEKEQGRPLTRLDVVRLGCVGMLMGAAEVVPGVSGGTIAFISGIYERLIFAIRQFTPSLIFTLTRQGIKVTWQRVDGNFLAVLFGAMLLSVVLFASGIGWLLDHQPIGIWSFFFGLVVASIGVVSRQIGRFDTSTTVCAVFGIGIGAVLVAVSPANLEATPLLLFAGGAVAVCAWILPGMSGSFILLILGLYSGVLEAVRQFDLTSLIALAAGCGLGLMAFAQVLGALLRRYRGQTVSLLTGFMIGSLLKLWPWQAVVAYQLRPDGTSFPLVQEPVLPFAYEGLAGSDPQLMLAVAMAVAGAMLVLAVDVLSRKIYVSNG